MKIKVLLYYHLKEKAGTGNLDVDINDGSTIKDLKLKLVNDFPCSWNSPSQRYDPHGWEDRS